jgi:hypothetical protein
VGLELTVLWGLVAGGLVFAYRGAEATSIGGDLLRVFVGYRLLQEVFVRTEPGLNALPGWASPAEQAVVFEGIAAAHLAPVATVIEVAVLPAIGVWALAFAVVQTACGVALLVGYRTRLFGTIAAGYLTLLACLGFVRLAPLVLVSVLAAATLGGRNASLDAVSGRELRSPPIPDRAAVPALAAAGHRVSPVRIGRVHREADDGRSSVLRSEIVSMERPVQAPPSVRVRDPSRLTFAPSSRRIRIDGAPPHGRWAIATGVGTVVSRDPPLGRRRRRRLLTSVRHMDLIYHVASILS